MARWVPFKGLGYPISRLLRPQNGGDPDRWIVLAFGFLFILCLSSAGLIRSNTLDSPDIASQDQTLPILPANAGDIPVKVGAYIENIYDFSPENKSFGATGVIWLKWNDAAEAVFKAQGIEFEKWLDFVNLIDGWDFALETVHERPLRLKSGEYLQSLRFHGHFYATDLDFHKFPFQQLRLPLVFELTNEQPSDSAGGLLLTPDAEDSKVGAYIDILGYKTTTFDVHTYRHRYATHFGMEDRPLRETRQIVFEVTYRQSVNAALLALFLPLAVVMALVLFSPMLSAALWDIRLGIPPTALLALIFLQQGYKENLPTLPYPTYMDMVYNASYIINLILFGLFLWASNQLHRAPEQDRAATIMRIDRIDAQFQVGLVILLLLLLTVDWLLVDAKY